MKVVFLGTPEFAVEPLKRLVESQNVSVIAVVTNKDKPVGRKKILTPPPTKVYAESKGIKVLQYDKIRLEGVEDLKALSPDLMITCAFGQILSKEILDIAKYGVFNIHASLLPKYRGASPVHEAILRGEKQTGVTIMKTDVGIDTGDIILSKCIDIIENETCGELFNRLSTLGADCIIQALEKLQNGSITFTPQDNEKATFTKIIKKEDALLNFNDTAENLVNKVRAYNPSPVAFTYYQGLPFKIYSAKAFPNFKNLSCGEVFVENGKIYVGAKDGAIELLIVQKAGGKPMDSTEFLKGNVLPKTFLTVNYD